MNLSIMWGIVEPAVLDCTIDVDPMREDDGMIVEAFTIMIRNLIEHYAERDYVEHEIIDRCFEATDFMITHDDLPGTWDSDEGQSGYETLKAIVKDEVS